MKNGVWKLTDFGLAKGQTSQLTSIKGTPAYLALEQAMGRPYTSKVDVWAFGLVVLELMQGQRINKIVKEHPAFDPAFPSDYHTSLCSPAAR
jgi:serine/threonine protein kinase